MKLLHRLSHWNYRNCPGSPNRLDQEFSFPMGRAVISLLFRVHSMHVLDQTSRETTKNNQIETLFLHFPLVNMALMNTYGHHCYWEIASQLEIRPWL